MPSPCKRHYYRQREPVPPPSPGRVCPLAENFLYSIRAGQSVYRGGGPAAGSVPGAAHGARRRQQLRLCLPGAVLLRHGHLLRHRRGGGLPEGSSPRRRQQEGHGDVRPTSSPSVKDWQDDGEIRHFLAKLIRKEAGDRSGLIYGMGHAIYTLSDPRAVLLKQFAKKLADKKDPKCWRSSSCSRRWSALPPRCSTTSPGTTTRSCAPMWTCTPAWYTRCWAIPQRAVHPSVRHGPYRGLVRPPGGGGLQPRQQDHPPRLQGHLPKAGFHPPDSAGVTCEKTSAPPVVAGRR